MVKVITWVDLEGRYRVTSPAYGDPTNPLGETEDETIARVLTAIKQRYGLLDTHTFHFVEDASQRARLLTLSGTYFRYGVFDADARAGAWEMDVDGHPKVIMTKARQIQVDKIANAKIIKSGQLETLERQERVRGKAIEANQHAASKVIVDAINIEALATQIAGAVNPLALSAIWPTELQEFKP